jgi:hypothetical protein
MKCLKLAVLGGVVLALSTQAFALTWLTQPSGQTSVRFDIVDWTMGHTYATAGGGPVPLTEGIAAVDGLVQNAVPGALPIAKPQVGPGGIGASLLGVDEDIWGLVYVQGIIADPGSSPIYWQISSDPSSEIVGMVYGGVDTYVYDNPGSGEQQVSACGLFLDIYEQPKGTFSEYAGSGGRLAFDQYLGVGYSALNTMIPGAKLLLSLESTDGDKDWANQTLLTDVDADGDPDGDFEASFNPGAIPGTGVGDSSLFWDLVAGEWSDLGFSGITFEVKDFYFPLVDPRVGVSRYGDLHSDQNVNPYFDPAAPASSDWLTSSDDPTRGLLTVPEPMTLAGLSLGIGALARYVRRRR